MATLNSTQPDSHSFLSPVGFQFGIQKLPNVNYFVTKANIPDISLGQIDTIDNTFIKLPVPGDKLSFGLLNITFNVDEDLNNYKEIYDWMIGLGFPDNFQQRGGLAVGQGIQQDGVYSDATLIVTTAQYRPNMNVRFVDTYPVNLTTLEFDVQSTDIEYLTASATFAYRKYELDVIE